jgi:hypothetical protein
MREPNDTLVADEEYPSPDLLDPDSEVPTANLVAISDDAIPVRAVDEEQGTGCLLERAGHCGRAVCSGDVHADLQLATPRVHADPQHAVPRSNPMNHQISSCPKEFSCPIACRCSGYPFASTTIPVA